MKIPDSKSRNESRIVEEFKRKITNVTLCERDKCLQLSQKDMIKMNIKILKEPGKFVKG